MEYNIEIVPLWAEVHMEWLQDRIEELEGWAAARDEYRANEYRPASAVPYVEKSVDDVW